MPIVDGLTSTKMIRSMEHRHSHQGHSALAAQNGRIPIFAVSASLVEREKDTYVDAGFDGWILKPVDFKRLNTLLLGIADDAVRTTCLYEVGEWERGGWFCRRHTHDQPAPLNTGEDESETPRPEPEGQAAPAPDVDSVGAVPDAETAITGTTSAQ